MSIKLRRYRRGGWEVDIQILLPNGKRHRARLKCPASSRSGARRWAEQRERHLISHGTQARKEEVPTLEQFKPRFIQDHCKANKQKPSGIESKEYAFRCFLLPLFAQNRLDHFSQSDIAKLKGKLSTKSASTTNNVLSTLSVVLRCAADWGSAVSVKTRGWQPSLLGERAERCVNATLVYQARAPSPGSFRIGQLFPRLGETSRRGMSRAIVGAQQAHSTSLQKVPP